jgi:hypothetical protein
LKKSTTFFLSAPVALAAVITSNAAHAGEQDAIDGCIDQLRKVGGPDARSGGTVLSSEFSEAGTLVMLRDGGGTVWRCIGYSDGAVGELQVVDAADDGGGAMAGAPQASSPEPSTSTQRIRFQRGESGAELTGTLSPGSSARYVLGAKNGQDLYVRVAPRGGAPLEYQIFNPDDSFLLDQISANREYRGQLWQSGDHVVEVINRGNSTASYSLIVGID